MMGGKSSAPTFDAALTRPIPRPTAVGPHSSPTEENIAANGKLVAAPRRNMIAIDTTGDGASGSRKVRATEAEAEPRITAPRRFGGTKPLAPLKTMALTVSQADRMPAEPRSIEY